MERLPFCCSSLFFFLMVRRPPTSTLFPSRRSSDQRARIRGDVTHVIVRSQRADPAIENLNNARAGRNLQHRRSEEHTSELQSHHDLVCRLLLEKKQKARRSHPAANRSARSQGQSAN